MFRQKSPIAVNRFDELDLTAENLERPKKKVNTQVHGKAKALYTFHAQNKRWGSHVATFHVHFLQMESNPENMPTLKVHYIFAENLFL